MTHLGQWLLLLSAGFCFAVLALVCWFALDRRRRRERAAVELQLRLAQSASSARELAELLQSQELRSLLAAPGRSGNEDRREQAVRSVRLGFVVLCASVATWVLSRFVLVKEDVLVVAGVCGAAAVGLLLSVLVAEKFVRAGRSDG
jgi:hypothetical protein